MRIGRVQTEAGPSAVVFTEEGARYVADSRDVGDLVHAGLTLADVNLAGPVDKTTLARPMAPLVPGKIVAIGLNYLDHVRETGMDPPTSPVIFTKFPSSVIGQGAEIVADAEVTSQVDWEVELAVVIGRRTSRVSRERALDAVAGYTVANDVSARDLQFGDGQWVRGKSLDTFCPLGPALVTPDEAGDVQALALRTRVNGQTMQDSSTSLMVFPVAELIEFCSRHFVLERGDVLLTGTPWGCGAFMTPPQFLQPGDVVEVEVEGLGVLRNPVTESRVDRA